MLVLNSVEKVLRKDGEFFINSFLKYLLENCPTLTIMISSCEWINYMPTVPSWNIEVMELDKLSSVNLFIELTE